MAEQVKRSQAQSRGAGQEDAAQASQVSITAPEVPEEVRTELTSLMQDLLLKTHELSFEYSTLDCESIQACSLAQKCREIFKIVKRLNQVVKGISAPQRKPSYTT